MDKIQQIIRIIIVGSMLLGSSYLIGSLVNKKWKIEPDKGNFFRFSSICIAVLSVIAVFVCRKELILMSDSKKEKGIPPYIV